MLAYTKLYFMSQNKLSQTGLEYFDAAQLMRSMTAVLMSRRAGEFHSIGVGLAQMIDFESVGVGPAASGSDLRN